MSAPSVGRSGHAIGRPSRSRLVALASGLLLAVEVSAPSARAAEVNEKAPDAAVRPTIQYDEALAHAADTTTFTAGGRVTVPFKPRKADKWAVGGVQPQMLPAGRLSGKAIRRAPAPAPDAPTTVEPAAAVGAVDVPYVDGLASTPSDLAAAVDPGGLKREVFGFLPYWELTDSSTRLDWEKLSTVAYFGVGASASGGLERTNANGSTTVGWGGWTSAKMTSVINAAHASGARVVLTVQSFAWSSAGAAKQKSLLGSAVTRNRLARQIAAAVRDRGADGVNLDFEPIVATYADEFTTLVRSVRTELNRYSRGYQLTFDATGWIGNYPIQPATAPGGADAVVIMGYDYRSSASNPVGSIAPISGAGYDIGDTVAAYLGRVPASKLILGVPYYGRAWSTTTSGFHSQNISGTKYGASTTVLYTVARQYAADHGRHWSDADGAAWTAYKRQNCTTRYGCVTPWRQIYYDDAKALGLKYDLVNRYNLRGVGIWALGYDGTRTELYSTLKAKFITDKVPPVITSSTLSSPFVSPNGDGRMDTTTVRVAVTGHIRFGWYVQPYFDGVTSNPIRAGEVRSKTVGFTWDGKNDAGAAVRDGPYRITVWAADASNNRALAQKVVTVDKRGAVLALSANLPFLSPNGDGHSDTSRVTMTADEAVAGTARVLNGSGTTIRKWTFPTRTSRYWIWDGRNSAGTVVPDGRYTLEVKANERAGNQTVSRTGVRVDRTIRSVTWARAAFTPRAGQTDRATFRIGRSARVSLSIFQGSTLVRTVWTNHSLAAGSYGWTWNGKTSAGAFVRPGKYRVKIAATSSIGYSEFSRAVTVRAP